MNISNPSRASDTHIKRTINKIASRWLDGKRQRIGGGGTPWNREETVNCITACHGKEHIDIDRLLTIPDPSFGHDVTGIQRFTAADGTLGGSFSPRCGVDKR